MTATVSPTTRCPYRVTVAGPDNPFHTEYGETLSHVDIVYESWGTLNDTKSNTVLIVHALTGDSHALRHGPDDIPGWWEALVGPGRAIDTDRYYVICANILGSCYGSTGPRSVNPETGIRYDLRFPFITVRDIVETQARLLDRLGIASIHAVIGGSLGGMQALEWAAMYPQRVERTIPVATSGQFAAQGIALNEIQRRTIMLDPAWKNGLYEDDDAPHQGLALARMLGVVSYQSDELMTARFGRSPDARYTAWPKFLDRYDVEGYIHYQGDKLVKRFDANSYLYLTRAMDSHDLGRGRGTYDEGLARIEARTLMIGIRSDILFPAYQVEDVANRLARLGRSVDYWELDSPNGHDGFLNDVTTMAPVIQAFLET